MAKTLYIIDGHAQFFRAYHAIRTGMTSPVTQEPTNMTFGFVSMMLKLLREYRPDYVAVVIDVSGDRESFRSEMYPEYKANRPPPPEDLHSQIERCLQILNDMHVPVLGQEGVEADDVIATIVRRLQREQPELNIRIVSKDKDLTQLLSDHVELFDVHKDQSVTAEDIFKVPGVKPENVIDILTLMGDTVDNVPGVPGIGPKTAAQLILKYGSVENLLSNLGEIKGKRRDNLEASTGQLPLSRSLVTLKDDVAVDFSLDRTSVDPQTLPTESLLATFRELGFNRLQDELRALTGNVKPHVAEMKESNEIADNLFTSALASRSIRQIDGQYTCIRTVKKLNALIKELRSAGEFAIDTETDGLAPVSANLCGVSVAIEPGTAWYIPVRSPEPAKHLDTETVLNKLKPILEDSKVRKVGHNLKFDLNVLRKHGMNVNGATFDTMIASYVVDATRSSHKMDVLALALLNHTCIPLRELIGTGKKQITFDQVPLDQAVPYAAEDADITLRLRDALAPQIKSLGLTELFHDVEMPLVEVLAELEWNGIRLDPAELDRQREKLSKRIDTLRQEISDAAPVPFNPDSPKQLAAVLFNKPNQEPPGLGIKPLKRRKTGPSTDVEVLEKLAADPEIESNLPQLIVEYRQLTKLLSTYLVALKDAINPATGRVHASFHQTVAATGRLSSSDPNLQNIPIRTDVGREIRRAFIAEPGNVLITADYSQIELRLLAHFADDPALIDAFQKGEDIHTTVAAEVFGVATTDVTTSMRHSAKMVNFGIIYGITPFGLARRLSASGAETSNEEAAKIIADYKARFSRIDTFLKKCVESAKKNGFVETILKRRRDVPQVHARNPMQRALGERMAINTVVQGSAADLIKLAMINLHRELPENFSTTRMVLQIHDELVFETPEPNAEEVSEFVKDRMQHAMEMKVPLVVESAWSTNWIDAK